MAAAVRHPSRCTAEVTAGASSTWSSTGPTAAGASPGAWTERESDDRADQPPGTTGRPTQLTRAPRFDLPAATHSYLTRAASSLQEAMTTSEVPLRYACAHVAALRATAALLAARATPTLAARRGRQQKNAWVLLAQVAPELGEWAAFFSAGAAKRAAAESGSLRAVTEREADDLVRDADRFLGLVEESLGHDPARAAPGAPRRPARPGRCDHVA